MSDRSTKLAAKIILMIIALVIVTSLVISGSCDGPIDQIFGWRDKTGCGGKSYLGLQTEGKEREIGAIASIYLFLFIAFYYVLYRLWLNCYKRK